MLAATDDVVTVAWNGRSTQTNGKSYIYCGIEVFRVVDGKIVQVLEQPRDGRALGSAKDPQCRRFEVRHILYIRREGELRSQNDTRIKGIASVPWIPNSL